MRRPTSLSAIHSTCSAVGVREADEHSQPAVDPAGDAVADAHAGACYALNQNSHDGAGMSTQEASGRMPAPLVKPRRSALSSLWKISTSIVIFTSSPTATPPASSA